MIAPERFLIVQCESEPGLAVIWDTLEQQVIDVIDTASATFRHFEEIEL